MTTYSFANRVETHLNLAAAQPTTAAASTVATAIPSRVLGSFLLAAAVSGLLVVVNQVLDAWSENHVLMAWAALWAIGFVAIAVLATPAHRLARSLRTGYTAWRAESLAQAQEDKMWALAKGDPRIMAEINAAFTRNAG